MSDRKIIASISDSGRVSVVLAGGHTTERELKRILKAIKLERKKKIREYHLNRKLKRLGVNDEQRTEENRG
jgi:hypothetical protein